MGPKEQNGRKIASKRGRPRKQPTLAPANKVDSKKTASIKSKKNSTHTPTLSNLPGPSSQFLLGRTNKLSNFLTSSQETKVGKNKQRQKSKKQEFEEDDGFIYKRSQSVDFSDDDEHVRRRRMNNPLSQLQRELGNISDDDEDILMLDLKPIKKAKKQLEPKSNKNKTTGPRHNNNNNDNSILTDENLQLLSSIGSTYKNRSSGSSDGYVEQVSHHKLDLVDEDSIAKVGRPPLKRRNSYYNRGKRVLSIGNGFHGEPHNDVPVSDYYKLVDTSLPDPDRLRQLLVWCFKKKLDDEEKLLKTKVSSTEDQTIINIAKVIKEEILMDLMEKQISVSWYSKPKDSADDVYMTGKEVVVPNPQNVINTENIDIYSKKLKDLIKEKKDWNNSLQRTIQPISNLSLKSFEVNDDSLLEYLKRKKADTEKNHPYEEIIQGKLIGKIEKEFEETKEKIITKLEPSVNKVADASYRLLKISELAKYLQENNLNDKAASLLKSYVIKNNIENYSSTDQNSSWPIPKKLITTRELLRGITRLETSKK